MNIIDRLLNELFPKKKLEQNSKEILIREKIKRNRIFMEGYKNWLKADMLKGMLTHIQENRILKSSNAEAEVNYFQYREPAANGFYFLSESPWNTIDYSFLIQYFIDKLNTLGYALNNSVREAIEEQGSLKTVERFYLKPKLKFRTESPYDQLYGNIFVEHRMLEDQTNLVKLMASVYADRNFKDPYEFDDLLNELLLF